jgi:hypothetical protein
VDDAVVHCVREAQANEVVAAIADRMERVGVAVAPDKTKTLCYQDGTRRS